MSDIYTFVVIEIGLLVLSFAFYSLYLDGKLIMDLMWDEMVFSFVS